MRFIFCGIAAAMMCPVTAAAATPAWLPTWYAAPAPTPDQRAEYQDLTIRQVVHITAGGQAVRITLSNAYGAAPLHVDAASLAHRVAGAETDTPVALTFGGAPDATIAPGASVISDAANFAAAPQSDLAVSLHVAQGVLSTGHFLQRSAIYFAQGNVTAATPLSPGNGPASNVASNLVLSRVDVAGGVETGLIVAFGDSITDGFAVKGDAGLTWPDRFYDRLKAGKRKLAIINAGITGNRLTRPPQWAPFGDMGLKRFDRDVLEQPGLRDVIAMIGINDIGQSAIGRWDYASAEDIENGLSQLIDRAHARQVRIYLATLTPFRGAKDGYYTDDKEAIRQQVNAWIRKNDKADGIADFDKALDDPASSGQMNPVDDSGDHLHPNANGAAAMANAVPLDGLN